LLYYPREGHSLEEWFLNIYKNLKNNNLLNNKIFFVFGDNDFSDNYNKFLVKNNLKDFLIPINFDYYAGDYLEKATSSITAPNLDKKYDFLFYNGKLRPHRVYAVSELKKYGLLDNGLVSLTASTHSNGTYSLTECVNVLENFGAASDHLDNFVKDFKPMILDMPGDRFSQNNINNTISWHYTETFFSIISETTLENRFITEKIYKPIFNFHPFIVIGAPGILELLKEKGYYTFEELFDESYDNEPNHKVRIDKVIKEVEKFAKMSYKEKKDRYKKIIDKLIHNSKHYIDTTEKYKREEFLKIFTIIEKNV
jgi:hypothetical protein